MNELLFFLMILLFIAMALQAVLERIVARERAPTPSPPRTASKPIVVRRAPVPVEVERAEFVERARAVGMDRVQRARVEPTRLSLEEVLARRAPPRAEPERAAVEPIERARALAAELAVRAREEPAREEPVPRREGRPVEAPTPAPPKPARRRRDWRRQAVVMREILGPPRALCASAADPVPR